MGHLLQTVASRPEETEPGAHAVHSARSVSAFPNASSSATNPGAHLTSMVSVAGAETASPSLARTA